MGIFNSAPSSAPSGAADKKGKSNEPVIIKANPEAFKPKQGKGEVATLQSRK
jgi:hypothetical protein